MSIRRRAVVTCSQPPLDGSTLVPPPPPSHIKMNENNSKVDISSDHEKKKEISPQCYKYILSISIISLILRLFRIGNPSQVVFDEVHFGGFASNYLRREYYFDIHPPIGKMIIAGIGYLLGYDGSFHFKDIGDSFTSSTIPYRLIRSSIALLSSFTTCINMLTVKDMGFSNSAIILSGILLSFDVGLTIQSRLILLDVPLLFFISLALWSWVLFLKERNRPFSLKYFTFLFICGFALGGAIGTKMVGLLTMATIGLMTLIDLWQISSFKKKLSFKNLFFKHLLTRFIFLFVLPISIYLTGYYIHFAILTKTGPGDPHMSSNFQSSLIGNNYSSGTRQVYYGNSIRIKNRLEPLFLHSHSSHYEVHYEDGRVSSGGQQVTLYSEGMDENNWWKILPFDDDLSSESNADSQWLKPSRRPVMNGDRVRLLHLKTGTYLRTHDVASTLTKTNMEISTTMDRGNDDTIWLLETKAPTSSSKPPQKIRTLSCQLRILSPKYSISLNNYQQVLPEWAHEQIEVNGDKKSVSDSTRWIIDDILEAKNVSDEIQEKIDTFNVKKLSFWEKFLELQELQLTKNDNLLTEHPFQSSPFSWPFLHRGISYWDKKDLGKRIYFQGNPPVWILGISAVFCLIISSLLRIWKLHRSGPNEDFTEDSSSISSGDNDPLTSNLLYKSGFILLSWAMHYLPFFTMRRVLYLHHYLPSLTMSLMIVGFMWDYVFKRLERKFGRNIQIYNSIVLSLISFSIIWSFWRLSPIIYGTSIPTETLNARKWFESWDWP